MYSEYSAQVPVGVIDEAFEQLRIPLVLPTGAAAPCARTKVAVAEKAPVIRTVGRSMVAELVEMRWSWPAVNGRPVYNFRAEGRGFPHGRCLIPADAYYERASFAPEPKRMRVTDEPWFCIAGLWRSAGPLGDAFTMLTLPPVGAGASTRGRHLVVLERADWPKWLDATVPASACLKTIASDRLQEEPLN